MRGKFITFEGIEGCGKSTHAQRLSERLIEVGHKCLLTREPGGTELGEAVRQMLQQGTATEPIMPEAELLMFEASRAQLVRSSILPALESGSHVVCDRFADSTTAYQGFGRGLDMRKIQTMNDIAIGEATPDFTILIDTDTKTGFERLKQRMSRTGESADRFERENMEFHERVRAGYLSLAKKEPDRFIVIDGGRTEAEVSSDVWEMVLERI
jgi:dTMP kinase